MHRAILLLALLTAAAHFALPAGAEDAPAAEVAAAGTAAAEVAAADATAGLQARIAGSARRSFLQESAAVERLRLSGDPGDAVELARRLKSGLRVSADNPLRVPRREEALAILRRISALGGEAGAAADAEIGAMLVHSRDPAEREEALSALRRSAAAGDGGSAVRLADAILAARYGDPAAEAEARRLYESALAKKEPGAAEGFARLARDPAVATTYRTQAMLLMKLRADKSGAAAFALAEAYRTGFGVVADPEAAARYYRAALATGYGPAVSIYVTSSEAPGPEVVEGLASALAAGSREAALALARAFLNRSSLPFGGEDAAFALRLLRETGNTDAAIIEARLSLAGRPPFVGGAAAAEAAVDEVVAGGSAEPPALLSYGRQVRDAAPDGEGPRLAMKLFLAAAAAGEPMGAVHAMELISERRIEVAPEAQAEVLELLRRAAEAGDGRSLLVLADLHRDGDGVERSAALAEDHYRRAIALADEPAAYERLASLVLETAESAADVREALDLYRAAADVGRAAATAAIGRILLSGRGEFAAEPREGERLLRQAAGNGYAPALAQLADHLAATGDPADLAEAEALYGRARDAGVTDGLIGLARLAAARGDRAAAAALLEEGVAAGSPAAMVELARSLVAGPGVTGVLGRAPALLEEARRAADKDVRLAFDIARAALAFPDGETRAAGLDILVRLAERGDSAAKRRLVEVHISGEAGVRSRSEALRWAELALAEGTVEPAVILGEAMLEGDDPALADPALGRRLLERAVAAAPGSVKALNRLGAACAAGIGGPVEPEKAFGLFLRAAEAGSVTAGIRVASAYLNGSGVARNPAEAYHWYRLAAASGSRDAMLDLARMYASGAGTSIDAEQSFVWFHRAAELGSVEGMQEVGKALVAGYGTVRDEAQGEAWLERAAAGGSVGAMYDLYSYHSLSEDRASREKALGWLARAAENGSAAAMFRLAVIIRDDPRFADRREEAVAWLRRAADAGHKGAVRQLEALGRTTGSGRGGAAG